MYELFTAGFLAAEAQRRYFDSARFDRPATERPARWRSFVAALFTRSTPTTDHVQTGLGRLAAA